MSLHLAHMSLLFKSSLAAGPRRSRSLSRNHNLLLFLQPRCHPLEGHLAIGMLRSPLRSRHNHAARAVQQPHTCLNFIAVLPAWTTGDKELHVAVAL